MFYCTTRNKEAKKTFAEIVCLSNAPCGGLYIPVELPKLKKEDFLGMNYAEIAEKIISIFTEIPQKEIPQIVGKSLVNFASSAVFETKKLEENITVAELFYGPTLSFKDYPMQFLGNIVEYILSQSGKKLNILTATSGDTGSAAIHAFAGKENVKIVVLHPKGRITEFQRKQMTTCHAKNVLNIAIDGNFDDCQTIVKDITNSNIAEEKNISTVNSINWGRIMMQIVYYIKLLSNVRTPQNIFVPTGNFGNIFACYFLKKCGFDGINKMFIANNANDVIPKFYEEGVVRNQKTIHTVSPAIDISIPSNFERMLFMESGENAVLVKEIYTSIKQGIEVQVKKNLWQNFQDYFHAFSVNDVLTLQTIKEVYNKYNYIIDPHTAVAFAHLTHSAPKGNNVVIATAHPCKFEEAVKEAIGIKVQIPQSNVGVMQKEERLELSSNKEVREMILDFFG
jgi:threonine synthase